MKKVNKKLAQAKTKKPRMTLHDFLNLPPKELEKALLRVVDAANRDQKALVDKYTKKTQGKRSK